MLINTLYLTMALALAPQAAQAEPQSPSEVFVDNCKVVSIQDQEVPGHEAGTLAVLEVTEGMIVKKEHVLGRGYTKDLEAQRKVKQYEFETADEKAKSDVDVRYAAKSAEVAKKGYEKAGVANKKSPNTVTDIEVRKLELEWQKAVLGKEKAVEDGTVAMLTAKSKGAEVDAIETMIDRRTLRAPFDGVIVEVKKHPGEWVAPGEGVVRIVRIDRLRVHGTINATQFSPSDVEGRRVTVNVSLPGNKSLKVDGKLMFASPVVDVGGKLPVYAEIDNQMDSAGRPIVRHGLDATMTIHLTGAAAAEVSRPNPRNAAQTDSKRPR